MQPLMGFTVAEEVNFEKYGVSATDCYVTIRATYSHNKSGSQSYSPPMIPGAQSGPYTLSARYYVYASQEAGLSPLLEASVMLNVEEAPVNPIQTLYDAIKLQYFAGKTITDLI